MHGESEMSTTKKDRRDQDRRNHNMAALATPKRSAYIVKKSFKKKLLESKTPENVMNRIKHNAETFEKNNLNRKK